MAIEQGQGYTTEASMIKTTRPGKFPNDNSGGGQNGPGGQSQGEVPGAGSIYAAMLNERPNMSNPRNQGPTRPGSRVGESRIPVTTMETRKTGEIT